jgi:hypothetical protein
MSRETVMVNLIDARSYQSLMMDLIASMPKIVVINQAKKISILQGKLANTSGSLAGISEDNVISIIVCQGIMKFLGHSIECRVIDNGTTKTYIPKNEEFQKDVFCNGSLENSIPSGIIEDIECPEDFSLKITAKIMLKNFTESEKDTFLESLEDLLYSLHDDDKLSYPEDQRFDESIKVITEEVIIE